MVQGRLLMDHPGSIHGEGEAPGGQSSLRQGVGKRSIGGPDLGSAAEEEQGRDREKGSCLPMFPITDNIYAKGGSPEGHQGSRRPPGAAPPLGAPGGRMGPWWVPSGPS